MINNDDDFSYCDCECTCDGNDSDFSNCECDCNCSSFDRTISINKELIRKIRTNVPGVAISLPNRAGTKRIPHHTPINVRIPRSNIIHSLPDGSVRKSMSEPESLISTFVSKGIINVCVIILPGAKVGGFPAQSNIPVRVKLDIDAANKIWKQEIGGKTLGVHFNVVETVVLEKNPSVIGKNTENFPWNQSNIDQILFSFGKRFSPGAHVYVFYMNGNSIGPIFSNGGQTDAITFRSLPIIILSNSALSKNYILAHELGHFMYINNRFGYKYDPDPYPGDPDHNCHPSNLMYPSSDFWPKPPQKPTITTAQIRKALNTRFFY